MPALQLRGGWEKISIMRAKSAGMKGTLFSMDDYPPLKESSVVDNTHYLITRLFYWVCRNTLQYSVLVQSLLKSFVNMSTRSSVQHLVSWGKMQQYQNALQSLGSTSWDIHLQRLERACISMVTRDLMWWRPEINSLHKCNNTKGDVSRSSAYLI